MEFVNSYNTVAYLIYLIKNKISKNYLRFGDGDFYLMEGQYDLLASPSQEMINSYNKLMTLLKPTDMISVPFYRKSLNTLEEGMKPGIHEYPDHQANQFIQKITSIVPKLNQLYSHVALHQAIVHYPELYSKFLKAIIKNNSTIILGNKDFDKDKIKFYLGNSIYIGANANNSYFERERIWNEFDDTLNNTTDFTVCILALGCGGRAMSHQFIEDIRMKNRKVLIIDIGSSIDVLMGLRNTRAWVEMTDPNVNIIDNLLLNNNNNESNNLPSLTELGLKYSTDKATYHSFTGFYDNLLSLDRENVKTLIEVGVAGGSSIKMWREYFKNSKIYCFDYSLDCANTVNRLKDVIFSYANQDSKESLKNAISNDIALNSVDIIIDDGGHFSTQQRNTLEVLWPYLKSGGVFIVEDIHTNIRHWYPNPISWNANKYYWDESPTMFDTLLKIQTGVHINNTELNIPLDEIKQVILWSQPSTTSATYVLIKK